MSVGEEFLNGNNSNGNPEISSEILALASRISKKTVISNVMEPKPREDYVEIGVDKNLPFTSPYKDVWLLPRRDDVSIQKLVAMRKTDTQVQALYRLITLPIMAALKDCTFVPAEGQKGGREEADFIKKMFTLPRAAGGMETPFRKVISQFLLAITDGFSPFELVYNTAKFGPLKGKVVLSKIAYRPAETIEFLLDDNGDWYGLRQRTHVKGKILDETIYRKDCAVYSCNEAESSMYGLSYFNAAFYAYDKKVKLYYLAQIMGMRSAVGTRMGSHPANADPRVIKDFAKQLADFGTNNWMRFPDTFKVESLKEGGTFDILGLINHLNSQISKSLLATFLDENQGGGNNDGSFVDFGQQSDAFFILLLESIIQEIEDVINNDIIPKFINWNFNTTKYPTFHFGQLTQEQKSMIVKMFQAIATVANQGNMTPEFVFEMEKYVSGIAGFEIDYDAIEKEKADQAEAEKKLQEEQVKAQQAAANAPPGTAPPGTPNTAPATPAAPAPQESLDIPENLLPKGFR